MPQQKPIPSKPTTIPITNFSGRLTRIINGDLNSGFAKFNSSFGYDPFSKPMNLTWLETPTSIAGISDLVTGAKTHFEGSSAIVYAVGNTGKAYRIQPNDTGSPNFDSVIGTGSVTAGNETYVYGASIEFFGTPERMYIGGDKQVNSLPMTSVVTGAFAGDARLGNVNNYVANTNRPLKSFQGKLLFGNGPTIGAIDTTNTITSSVIGVAVPSFSQNGGVQPIYSELNPPFPPENVVHDMDVSIDYNYLLMTVSDVLGEDLATVSSDRPIAAATVGNVYQWNGSDSATTAGLSVPSQSLTALQTYLQKNIMFANDAFGLSMGDGVEKTLSLPGNKSPISGATGVNGNFIFWHNVEVNAAGNAMYASLYYYGQLDNENPVGLYRVLRYSTTLANGFVYQVPVNLLVNNRYMTINNALTAIITLGWGKHYFSTLEVSNLATNYKFYRFLITPSGTGTPQLGVYETQSQLFSKRVGLAQIRVYTEPVITGNGFQIDIIGEDGNPVTNGTFTYTYGDPVDKNVRINFNPNIQTLYSFGIRITNTGTTNMTIKKIEIDLSEEGK